MTNQERANKINNVLPALHSSLLHALYFALEGTGVDSARVFSLVSDTELSGEEKLLACELAFERETEIFGMIRFQLSRALLEKDLGV
ncbi:hypothetical protein ACOARM_11650 [Pseudomonas aeruginosa]